MQRNYSKELGGILIFLVTGLGIGYSSWAIVCDANAESSNYVNVDIDNIEYVKGSALALNKSKGENDSGIDSLKYCNKSGSSNAIGLIYNDEIGNKGNIKLYFSLNVNTFKNTISWTKLAFTFALSYSTTNSNFSLINDNISASLDYFCGNTSYYNNIKMSNVSCSGSVKDNTATFVTGTNLDLDTSKRYLNFELETIFTVSDASKVISNECKQSNLFNLHVLISEGA